MFNILIIVPFIVFYSNDSCYRYTFSYYRHFWSLKSKIVKACWKTKLSINNSA